MNPPFFPRKDDEARISAALASGDREALALAILVIARRVILPQVWKIPPGLDLDDVLQEATLKALEGLRAWRPGDAPANVWVWRAIEQSLLNQIRAHQRWSRRFKELVVVK